MRARQARGPNGETGAKGETGPIGPAGPAGSDGTTWARSVTSDENSVAIPILVINTPSVLGAFAVTTPETGDHLASWKVTVQPPLALVGITCARYAEGVAVPGSQTQITVSQSVLAPVPVQGTALAADLPAATVLAPGCMSNLLGTVMVSARLTVSSVSDGAVSVI